MEGSLFNFNSKKLLFLIDGNSFCYRAFYAIRDLSNSKGRPTNAIYGFVNMLNKLLKEHRPDYIAVSFDLKAPTIRHKIFKEYKIHRKPMPDELVEQIPVIKEIIKAYNIPIYEMEGYEADDILATLAKEAERQGILTYIVTGDKDALQLINVYIKVYNTHKDGYIYDEGTVKEKFGVPPGKIRDLLALMGDKSDNIPGVPGIGEKTAVELILEFGSIENLYEKIDMVSSSAKRELLLNYKEQVNLSKELATLDCNVPLKIDLEALKIKQPDRERLLGLFKELEFRSLIAQLSSGERLKADYKIITTKQGLDELISKLKLRKIFAFDFETTSEDPMIAELVGVSFCWEEAVAWYIPFISPDGKVLDVHRALERLRPLFEDEDIKKIGQNIKYEKIVLANYNIQLNGIHFDTMVASYLLNPSKLNHNLGDISIEYIGYKMIDITELIGKGKSQTTLANVPVEKVSRYCCEDSDVTFRLSNILTRELSNKGLEKLFREVELPLIDVLTQMELNGVCLDTDFLTKMSADIQKKLDQITQDIYEIAGCEFNINSPKQLQEILFTKLKLPAIKRTKTGISTDEEVLRKLASQHSLPAALLEYRELSKLKSTYVDALPKLLNPKTHRVHTSFNQTVTATGRLSSSNPNLQNIPVKTELGRKIRKAFVPQHRDSYIVSADYSQIELRILAHLSKDRNLMEAFRQERDIHNHTASLIFGVSEDEVTSQMRSQAKAVNFGIVYGMSAYGLSRELNIEPKMAQEFIDAYFERYPDVKVWIDTQIKEAKQKGYVITLLNRRRYIPEINSQNNSIRQFAERTAINTPIQGSAADLIKLAMINIHRRLYSENMHSMMILQVHDELVFETPQDELDGLISLVKKNMEDVMRLSIPIKVNIAVGKNWLELKEIDT